MCRCVVKHQEGLVVGINSSSDFFQKIVEKLPVHPTNTSWSEVRDCGKLIQSLKERGIQQMCCFVILLLFNEMQMSVRRFSAIPHLRDELCGRQGHLSAIQPNKLSHFCHVDLNLTISTFPNSRPSITSRCPDVVAPFVNEDAVVDDPLRHKPVGIFIASLYHVGSVASSWYCSGHLYAYQHSIQSFQSFYRTPKV